jgi:decaprenyl-phosphate phosphoribosyltransferase
VVEARPKQWLKNVLVFAAPGAAGVIDRPKPFLQAFAAFACFSLAAAGTYFLNDAADVDVDRRHPTKRFRPIAAGEIPVPLARVVGVAAILGATAAATAVNWHLGVVIGCYVVITSIYSAWMKHVAILDVVGVAAGFVLRAIAGGAAVDVPISNWFFIVASFGSLFMVVGKRYSEASQLADGGVASRRVLADYPVVWLRQLRDLCVAVTLLAYCQFAFERGEGIDLSLPWYQLTILPVTLGLLRYSLQVERGEGGAPEDLVLSDRTLQACGLTWVILFGLGVGRV